ncbi:acyltransferase domain-containing protein [Nocardia sp. NPDC055053]
MRAWQDAELGPTLVSNDKRGGDEMTRTVEKFAVGGTGRMTIPWVISAEGHPELRARARSVLRWLEVTREPNYVDIGYSLATIRERGQARAVILGRDRSELMRGLHAIATDDRAANVVTGTRISNGGAFFVLAAPTWRTVLGARDALLEVPRFGASLRRCADRLAPFVGQDIAQVVATATDRPTTDQIEMLTPVCFVVHVAAGDWWRSYGVSTDLVFGERGSELAAAVVAGRYLLEDAAPVLVGAAPPETLDRARLRHRVRRLAGHGRNVVIELGTYPVLRSALSDLPTEGRDSSQGVVTIHPNHDNELEGRAVSFMLPLAQAYVSGVDVPWTAHFAGRHAVLLDLPN